MISAVLSDVHHALFPETSPNFVKVEVEGAE
jgi:hypothetical protein